MGKGFLTNKNRPGDKPVRLAQSPTWSRPTYGNRFRSAGRDPRFSRIAWNRRSSGGIGEDIGLRQRNRYQALRFSLLFICSSIVDECKARYGRITRSANRDSRPHFWNAGAAHKNVFSFGLAPSFRIFGALAPLWKRPRQAGARADIRDSRNHCSVSRTVENRNGEPGRNAGAIGAGRAAAPSTTSPRPPGAMAVPGTERRPDRPEICPPQGSGGRFRTGPASPCVHPKKDPALLSQ